MSLLERLAYPALEPGRRFVSPRRTLTETDHQLYMMLVGDWSPIHADAELARSKGASARMMHGGFGVSLTLGLQTAALEFADPMIAALGLDSWRFKAPLHIGDTVYVEVEILERRITSSGDRYTVRRALRLMKGEGVLCQEGEATALLSLPQPSA
jgi:acyl dehydratase